MEHILLREHQATAGVISRSGDSRWMLSCGCPGNRRKQSFFAPTERRRRASGTFFTTTKRGCPSGGISKCWRNRSEAKICRRITCRPHSCLHSPDPASSVASRSATLSIHISSVLVGTSGTSWFLKIPAARLMPPEILRQSLQIARRKLGLERVLVTCDDDNVGSVKTIGRTAASSRASSPDRMVTNRSAATGLPRHEPRRLTRSHPCMRSHSAL